MILTILITVIALVVFLVLNDSHVRVREVARLTYFAGLLVFLLQFGGYVSQLIKEVAR